MTKIIKYKLSIIIPVYNCEKYIKKCVKSILDQDLNKEIEIIIVNDGSTDKSGKICDTFIEYSNIKVFHRKNYGVSSTRNFGLTKAAGEYVYFVDADDIIFQGCLEYVIKAINENPDIISVGYKRFNDGEYEKNEVKQLSLKVADNITEVMERFSLSQNIIRKKLLEDNNLKLNEKLKYTEDMDLALEAIIIANKIIVIKEPIYGYRNNNSSATKIISSKRLQDLLYFIKKWSKKIVEIQDIKMKKCLGNFLAYQTLIALGMDNLSHSKIMNKTDCAILLDYHNSAKTRLGYVFYKAFGLSGVAIAMGKYLSVKRMRVDNFYG